MVVRKYQNAYPELKRNAYVDPQAVVIGDVTIGEDSSVWPCAVVRGDVQRIEIGDSSNVQDGAVCHVTHDSHYCPGGRPLIIGDYVTIGHNATIHACTIKDRVLIGMGVVVLDGAVIEPDVVVGAGSLVPPNKVLESGFLYVGSPVQKVRE